METLYALLITLLFGAWIWELKSQVVTLRQGSLEIGGEAVGGDENHRQPSPARHVPQHHARQQADAFSDPHSRVSRQNGVPTWVIE